MHSAGKELGGRGLPYISGGLDLAERDLAPLGGPPQVPVDQARHDDPCEGHDDQEYAGNREGRVAAELLEPLLEFTLLRELHDLSESGHA